MGTLGDALFFLRLVVISPEREPHSRCLLACWLPSDRAEHLPDIVNLGLVDLWPLGLAGLETTHVVSKESPEEGRRGRRTKAGRGYTVTPIITPRLVLIFPATTSSAMCSLRSLERAGNLVSLYIDCWDENRCSRCGILCKELV